MKSKLLQTTAVIGLALFFGAKGVFVADPAIAADTDPIVCPAGSFTPNGLECDQCPAGSSSEEGATACTPCAAGSYASQAGQSTCNPCSTGMYASTTGSTSCTLCSAGTYAYQWGSSSCTDCPAGTYSPYEGHSFCKECADGDFQVLSGQTSCNQCAEGGFSTSKTQMACTDGCGEPGSSTECTTSCPAGTYTSGSECVDCPGGSYSTTPGSSACTICAPGTYAPAGSKSPCVFCRAGTFAPTSGSSACEKCGYGEYQAATGSTSCVDCAPGTANNRLGKTSCQSCRGGSFQPSSGARDCEVCPAGTFNSNQGETTCTSCAAGTFSLGGASSCMDCPSGFFQGSSGSSTCENCAKGSFQHQSGSTACIDCAAHSESVGQSACDHCRDEGILAHWALEKSHADSVGINHITSRLVTRHFRPGVVGEWAKLIGPGRHRSLIVVDHAGEDGYNSLRLQKTMTMSAWVNPDEHLYGVLIGKASRAGNNYTLGYTNRGDGTFYFSLSGINNRLQQDFCWVSTEGGPAEQRVPKHLWTHVAATYDGENLRLYRNALPVAEAACSLEPYNGPESVSIGAGTYGLIDDVKIFNSVLSSEEIAAGMYDNRPPVAVCRDSVKDAGAACTADFSASDIDGGSSDPDEDALVLTLEPSGSFGLGSTVVALTADDGKAQDSCSATATVVDNTPPTLTSDARDFTAQDLPLTFTVTTEDNCGGILDPLSVSCGRVNGAGKLVNLSDSCGVTVDGNTVTVTKTNGVGNSVVIEASATDVSGNTASATFTATVQNHGQSKKGK